jgi:hypothetical protein
MNPEAAKKPRLMRGGEHTGKRKDDFNISEIKPETRCSKWNVYVVRNPNGEESPSDYENIGTICLQWT